MAGDTEAQYRAETSALRRLSETETGGFLLAVTAVLLWPGSVSTLLFFFAVAGTLGASHIGLLSTATRNTALCLCFYLCVWTEERLALFLPRFALRKHQADLVSGSHWRQFLGASVVDVLVLALLREGELIWTLSALTPYLVLVWVLERQSRALWGVADSHRRAEAQASDLFQRAEAPQFLVNSELAILELNASAFSLAHNCGLTTPHNQSIVRLFPEGYSELLTDMVQSALRGEVRQEELLLREEELQRPSDKSELALLVTVEPAHWQSRVCAKVLCMDVTPYVTRRLMVVDELESMHRHASALESMEEGLRRQDLWVFHMLLAKLRGAIVLQRHFIGALGSSVCDFNLRADLSKLLRVSMLPAEERGLDVIFTLGETLPYLCRGDRQKNALLFKALCDFALEHACTGSEVSITCKLEDRYEQKCKLSFRFAFASVKLSGPDVKSLFLKPRGQRQLSQMARVISDYGVGLAVHGLVLEAMGGHVVEAYVQDNTTCKILVSYLLPLLAVEGQPGEEGNAPSPCSSRWNFKAAKPHSVTHSFQRIAYSKSQLHNTRNSLRHLAEPVLFPPEVEAESRNEEQLAKQ